jgi:hypothetical protein
MCAKFARHCAENDTLLFVVARRSKKIVLVAVEQKKGLLPLPRLPFPNLSSCPFNSQIHIHIEDLAVSQRQELAVLVGSHSGLPWEAHPLPWRRGGRQRGWEVRVHCFFER